MVFQIIIILDNYKSNVIVNYVHDDFNVYIKVTFMLSCTHACI